MIGERWIPGALDWLTTRLQALSLYLLQPQLISRGLQGHFEPAHNSLMTQIAFTRQRLSFTPKITPNCHLLLLVEEDSLMARVDVGFQWSSPSWDPLETTSWCPMTPTPFEHSIKERLRMSPIAGCWLIEVTKADKKRSWAVLAQDKAPSQNPDKFEPRVGQDPLIPLGLGQPCKTFGPLRGRPHLQ